MATVKNTALHAVSLPSGRVLAPGKTATNVALADVENELEAGTLSEVKTTKKQKTQATQATGTTATDDASAQKED